MDKDRGSGEEKYLQEDEVDLYELYLIFKRRWKLLILIPLISTLTVAAYIYLFVDMKPRYEVYSLYPTNITYLGKEKGKLVQKVYSLSSLFAGNFPNQIEASLRELISAKSVGELTISQKGTFLKVSLLCEDIEEAKKVLKMLDEELNRLVRKALNENYNYDIEHEFKLMFKEIEKLDLKIRNKKLRISSLRTLINFKIFELKNKINTLKREQRKLKNELNLYSRWLNYIKEYITNIETKAKDIKNQLALAEFIKERNRLKEVLLENERIILNKKLSIENIRNQISVIEYRLKNKIPIEKKTIENSIKSIELDIKATEYKKKFLEKKINTLKSLIRKKRILEPVVFAKSSEKPVKPKRELIVAVSFVSSLILAVFIILLIEWFNSAKRRHSEA